MREKSRFHWSYLIAIVVVVIIVALVYYNTNGSHSTATTTTGIVPMTITALTPNYLADVPLACTSTKGCAYNWQITLNIYVNKTYYVYIPSNLGHLANGSTFAIHTNDLSGLVYIDCCSINTTKTFALGQLFEVWGYSLFNSSNCLIYHDKPVSAYVNGTLSELPVQNIPLTNHEQITIAIGSEHPTIPTNHTFTV